MNGTSPTKVRIAIAGGGLSGLALANALLNDPQQRYQVDIFERDTLSFDSERGGYQVRLGEQGITGLRGCLDQDTYKELAEVWGHELERSPCICHGRNYQPYLKLNDLKLYTKTRAVPRQALKDYLIKVPIKKNALHLSKRLINLKIEGKSQKNPSEVTLEFEDGTSHVCDILVAADGSNSTVNKLLGINNVTRLTDHPMLQGRGPLSKASYAQLPPTLLEHGSTGFQEPDFNGFIAVYEAYQKDKTLDSSSFIFWAVTLKKDYAEKLNAIPEGQNKALQIAETMEATGWDPEQIPKILRMACTNVKMSSMSTSTQPDGWRKNRPELGRAILIGDSIHAMTPARGMGANTALKDAAELAEFMLKPGAAFGQLGASDEEVYKESEAYDRVMYKRAFGWVKASENLRSDNAWTWSGWFKVKLMVSIMHLLGYGATVLEILHLRRRVQIAF